MTPRLTRRGLLAAGIAAVIGTRAASAAPKVVPGLYAAPASTYVSDDSTVSNLTVANTTAAEQGWSNLPGLRSMTITYTDGRVERLEPGQVCIVSESGDARNAYDDFEIRSMSAEGE